MTTTVHQIPLLAPVSPEELVEADFHLPTVKVISYAGPGKTGGVSTSLEPIVKRLGTKVHWFSVEDIPEADRNHDITISGVKSVPGRDGAPVYSVAREESSFKFYTPDLPQHVVDGHRRFAALHLWPLLHSQPELAEFSQRDWRAYQELCGSLASRCQSVQQESFPTLFWLHDYQFAMTAPLVAAEHGALVCQFWHVPWPAADKFIQSPVAKELVDAMLFNSVLGFHTAEYAHNFMETVEALFPAVSVDYMNMVISSARRKTRITVLPLGLDIARWTKIAVLSRPMAEVLAVKHRLANQILLGVDRLDYTKGVLEKLVGLETYLIEHPDMRRRFHYVQLSQLPHSDEKPFVEYSRKVNKKIDEINEKFETNGWKPIVSFSGYLTQQELAAWYQAADVMLVNSVSDGLNLIAKEFVACRRDEQGVLVLSERAGCAKELSQGAILVDPVNPTELSNGIARALSMGIEEKRRRMTSMRHVIGWNQLHDWALGFLKQVV